MGNRGGILVAWNTEAVEVSNPIKKEYSLSLQVRLKWMMSSFLPTVAYGPTNDAAKPLFLEELLSLKPTGGQPWLCLGDFNLIWETQDKSNLNINRRLMGRFRRRID